MKKSSKGFTLLELLVVVAMLTFLIGTISLTIDGSLASWSYTKEQLSLQKVLMETMNVMIQGDYEMYGLKDSMEIMEAEPDKVAFVPPWADVSHEAENEDIVYTLDKLIKPGAAVPIAQIKFKDEDKWRVVPVSRVEMEGEDRSQVRLGVVPPETADLRFVYQPDAEHEPETIHRLRWEEDEGAVYLEQGDDETEISKNPFGVKFTKVRFSYFTNGNEKLGDEDSVSESDFSLITGVEVMLEAAIGDQKQTLVNFISLRNSPMRTGYLTLRKGMKIPVPDSKNIHTLQLTNFTGIEDGDDLAVTLTDEHGRSWKIKMHFLRTATTDPQIQSYTIESPAGTPVVVEYPMMGASGTINLLTVGANNGLYDYDDDPNIEDFVLLEGNVSLEVTDMTIEGAGIFIRP